jgi:hypothetical protein
MTASRNPTTSDFADRTHGLPTAAVVRRRRRPPPWTSLHRATRPANRLRRITSAPCFNLIVDDYDTIHPVARTPR